MSPSRTVRMLSAVALLGLPVRDQRPEEPGRTPLTWETLEARLEAEVKAGFSGAVLVVRDGEIVLDRAFGLANREKGIANTPQTIFAIGSTPIDFTHAGILLLVEAGTLVFTDPLTTFFADVPADKRAITIQHLMSSTSGLVDFVDLPKDRDPDHGWIDRDELVRRVLGSKLLFEPGKGNEHSHAAWGLLAAIIEIATAESYPEFTRANLFEPAGMADTGFFGEPIPEERLALGYGQRKDGEINAPPYWGKTSWLVMGSGGQVSTTHDMLRWHQALRAGKILGPEMVERYFGPPGGVLQGGDMYGFEIVYTQGPGSQMIVVTNAAEDRERRETFDALANDLAELVNRR
jgi:CubicO group peptidase (beta-lactamase class C family)